MRLATSLGMRPTPTLLSMLTFSRLCERSVHLQSLGQTVSGSRVTSSARSSRHPWLSALPIKINGGHAHCT